MTNTHSQISLSYVGGGSDKVYHAQIVASDDLFVVNFQFGRRGSTLSTGTKTSSPVPLAQAEKIFNALIKEKQGKGYQSTEPADVGTTVVSPKTSFGHLPQLLNAISEDEARRLLSDDDFIMQQKHDGERRMVAKTHTGISASNRKGEVIPTANEITRSFTAAQACVVDGEHVGEIFVAFDVLVVNGQPLTELPYLLRLSALSSLSGIQIVATAHTTEEKTALFEKLQADGAEGVVFKRKDASYTPGRPNAGGDQLKFKFYATATCRVRALNAQRSVEVELLDGESFVSKGNVTIPPNKTVPVIGELIEVRYLYAYPGAGSLYQPTYIGVRDDVDCDDVSTLKLKS